MQVRYIYHSGFWVETETGYYLFDYFKGELPKLDPSKPITVFSSHGHKDHYNPAVFNVLAEKGMQSISAVLGKDIPPRLHPASVPVLRAHPNCTYPLSQDETLETLLSTDQGVAFLLTTGEGTIYHAGDLNDWTWPGEDDGENRQMRGSYRHQIDLLKGRHIDHAFVPLEPRQRQAYADGLLYFLKTVGADAVYPMHYWGKHAVIDQFLREYPLYQDVIKNPEDLKGDTDHAL